MKKNKSSTSIHFDVCDKPSHWRSFALLAIMLTVFCVAIRPDHKEQGPLNIKVASIEAKNKMLLSNFPTKSDSVLKRF